MFASVHLGSTSVRRVHLGSRGFTCALLKFVGHSGSRAWVHSYAPNGRRVHSGSRGFTRARLGLVWYIRDRIGSFVR